MTDENVIRFADAASRPPRKPIPDKLRDGRIAKRLTQTELAKQIGVTRQAVSAYEQGLRVPEPEILNSIIEALDQPLGYFLDDDPPDFGAHGTTFFRAFGPDTKRRNAACHVLKQWFAQTARYFDNLVNYPPLNVPAASPSDSVGSYTDDEIEGEAERCRTEWGLGLGPISNMIALLESKGVVVCRYQISGDTIQAFSFWSGPRPFIFLASDTGSSCRARFDVAHELGHLVLHRWIDQAELEDPKILKAVETEANRFGAAFLAPAKPFSSEIYTPRLDALLRLKARWKMAVQAMVLRCKQLELFDDDQTTSLYKQISYRRWRKHEPLDDQIPLEQPKLLCRAAELVLESGIRSADDLCRELNKNARDIEQFCNLVSGRLAHLPPPHEFRPTLR